MIQKEIDAGRVTGLFASPPFCKYNCFPVTIWPKKEPSKFRMIHDLSFPYDFTSVNSVILDDMALVQYQNIQTAIKQF